MSFIFGYLKRLNLFNTYGADEEQIQREIIATRIYIILLPTILTILIIYSAQKEVSYTVTINNPTLDHYHQLLDIYPNTLSCPCSQFSIPYANFISVIPQYHSVCSSDFISDQWLEYLYNDDASFYLAVDLRSVGNTQFQLIRTLCQSSKKAIENAFQSTFTSATLVNIRGALLQSNIVRTEVEVFVNDFINNIVSEQQRRRSLFTTFIDQNYLVTALETSAIPFIDTSLSLKIEMAQYYETFFGQSSGGFGIGIGVGGVFTCLCDMSYDCYSQVGICDDSLYQRDYFQLISTYATPRICPTVISGFKSGCMPLKSLLKSTLECYYNETCLNGILNSLPEMNNSFEILQKDTFNRTNPKTTIDTLANKLMVEQWSTQMNYSLYFNTCNPLSCSYSYTETMNILYIIATLLGLFGGLTAVLRFVCPQLANIFYQIKKIIFTKKTNNIETISSDDRKFNVFSKICHTLHTFNLFIRRNSENDDIRQQIVTTRFYISSLIIFTLILISVTIFDQRLITITVTTPNITEFEDLYHSGKIKHSCPCSQIAIQRSKFISLIPTFHQVCSSIFVSDLWIHYLGWSIYTRSSYYYLDIRSYALDMFPIIKSLCSSANYTIGNATMNFLNIDWVSTHVLPRQQFDEQIQVLITDFQTSIIKIYKQIYDLARQTNQGNQFLSSRLSNIFFNGLFDNSSDLISIQTYISVQSKINNTFSSYSCLFDGCNPSLGLFNETDDRNIFILDKEIPGLYGARYPLDGIRVSTLECLFNESCINMMLSYDRLGTISQRNFTALNPTMLIRYSPNTIMADIIDNLMIEQWIHTTDYQIYYNMCKPSTCSYTSYQRFYWIYTLTILTSVFGGLCVALRIICPLIVKKYFNCRRKRNESTSIHTSFISRIVRQIQKLILTTNLFDSDSPHDYVRYREQLTTRLYVILLTIIAGFLFVYLLFGEHIRTTTVKSPSSNQLSQLHKKYSTTLSCPCMKTSISYSNFLTLEVIDYHPICSSSFLSINYFRTLLNNDSLVVPESKSFQRQFLAGQLSLLADYCSLSRTTVNDSLNIFLRQKLISAQALTMKQFDEQINTTINQLLVDMSLSLQHSLDYFHAILHGNTIMSSYVSNWRFELNSTYSGHSTIRTRPVWYGNCSCASYSHCSLPMIIQNQSFPGLNIGCLPSSILLQSNLQCLYNQTCIDSLHSVLFDNISLLSLPTSINISSHFPINTLISSLFNKLFIENWFRQYNYESYFQTCEVPTCTYIYIQRPDILYVITTIIGLFGGLTVVLRLICPLAIKSSLYLLNFIRKKPITPTIHM